MLCKKNKGNSIIIRIMIPNTCDKNIRDLIEKKLKNPKATLIFRKSLLHLKITIYLFIYCTF